MGNKHKHFIALVAMEGDYTGKIGQHSTMQPNFEAADLWAKERFSRYAVIVDMEYYENANSLPDNIADMTYRVGTHEGKLLRQWHVIEVLDMQGGVQLFSDHYDQSVQIEYDNLPGSVRPELETAVKYLTNSGYTVLAYCAGKRNLSSHIITDTFKPLFER